MSEHKAAREHHHLRLAPEDVPLLWGIVAGFAEHMGSRERWPRLERILFDLQAMMEREPWWMEIDEQGRALWRALALISPDFGGEPAPDVYLRLQSALGRQGLVVIWAKDFERLKRDAADVY